MGFDLCYQVGHLLSVGRVRATHIVRLCQRQVIILVCSRQNDIAHLLGISLNADTHLVECQLGKGTSYNTTDSLTSRAASATTVVADAVFLHVGIVGMARAIYISHILIVLAVLVGVAY